MNGWCSRHPGARVRVYLLRADDSPDVQEACEWCLTEAALADAGYYLDEDAGDEQSVRDSLASDPSTRIPIATLKAQLKEEVA